MLSTDPGPGERVLDGGAVTIVLSLGKERYEVPKLRGMTEDEAQDALADAEPRVRRVHRPMVARRCRRARSSAATPSQGTSLRPGSIVDLYISKGPKPIRVKDFTGKTADRAEQELE